MFFLLILPQISECGKKKDTFTETLPGIPAAFGGAPHQSASLTASPRGEKPWQKNQPERETKASPLREKLSGNRFIRTDFLTDVGDAAEGGKKPVVGATIGRPQILLK